MQISSVAVVGTLSALSAQLRPHPYAARPAEASSGVNSPLIVNQTLAAKRKADFNAWAHAPKAGLSEVEQFYRDIEKKWLTSKTALVYTFGRDPGAIAKGQLLDTTA